MIAYKLVRKSKDGNLYPLFIDRHRPYVFGEKRIWIECDIDNYKTYDRPESQGGKWILADVLTAKREISFQEVDLLLKGNFDGT